MTDDTTPTGQTTSGGSPDETGSGDQPQTPPRFEFLVDPVQDPRKLQHLLVSSSYEGERIPGSRIRAAIDHLYAYENVYPVNVVAYTTTLCVPATGVALTDAWQALSDEDRLYIHANMPRLFTAIFLAVKGTTPPSKECGAVSDRGNVCVATGEHEWHLSPPGHDGRVSSEVWRA